MAGYVAKDIDSYGLLRLGRNARALDEAKGPIMFCMDRDFNDIDDEEAAAMSGTSALDEGLLAELKDLRQRMAAKSKLAPYVIFSDPALEGMATYFPMSDDELKSIPGVGEGKAVKFGRPFVEFIAKYVEDNEIDRPQDSVVKTVAKEEGVKNKVYIITGVDRKVPLDVLAQGKGLSMPDLIKAMESIVYSGTRLNLDYYLYEQYDRDQVDDVFAYFKEADDDSIKLAMEELSQEDYPEEMIRLVRIKFVSEVGN